MAIPITHLLSALKAGLVTWSASAFLGLMNSWNIRHGEWWMVQWVLYYGWFSLGIHVDLKGRTNTTLSVDYGPYVDIHLGWFIFSFGRRPYLSCDLDKVISVSRGGL